MSKVNIVIIVVDTLRKDYAKPLERELRKLGFISYDNAIAPATWTTPSIASLFTGLYPSYHWAHEKKDKKVVTDVKLNSKTILTEELSESGYETYLFTANPLIDPYFGYNNLGVVTLH